ncbi:hypothetical protein AB0G29_13150 [Streptomyces parvus]|uniref:hypothetical protein n=1 Tax=Streptomyces parvus TaxID=66428 RepID=UPI0033E4334F
MSDAKTMQVDPMSITDEKVMKTLKEVVAGNPDRIYEAPEHQLADEPSACFYVHTDDLTNDPVSPGCLVGQVLNRLGLSLDRLAELEGHDAHQAVAALGLPLTDRTVNALGQVQHGQDSGQTWGEAYARSVGEGI